MTGPAQLSRLSQYIATASQQQRAAMQRGDLHAAWPADGGRQQLTPSVRAHIRRIRPTRNSRPYNSI